jgi:acyl-CoA thioester hydrolase
LFRSLGLSYKSVENQGIFLPVSEAFCKYKNAARYDDVITIETSVDASVKGGLKLDYTILDQAGERVLATGYTKHACLDRNGRITRPPKFLRDTIQNNATST